MSSIIHETHHKFHTQVGMQDMFALRQTGQNKNSLGILSYKGRFHPNKGHMYKLSSQYPPHMGVDRNPHNKDWDT